MPCVDYEKLSGDQVGESSESTRARVQAARDIQRHRFSNNGSSDIVCNADMRVGEIRQFCQLQAEGSGPYAGGDDATQFVGARLSPHPETGANNRGSGGCEEIHSVHLAEALQYRPKLMMG